MNKTLTIVIPAFNMEKYVERCVGSLGIDELEKSKLFDGQSLADRLEVLVINDGSIDRTSEIAHRLEKQYPSIVQVIDKTNGHYGSCVNRGLSAASGTFIKVLDADDTFDTVVFGSFMRFLVETCEYGDDREIDLVVSDFQDVDSAGRPKSEIHRYSLPPERSVGIEYVLDHNVSEFFMPALTYRTNRLREMAYHQTEGLLYTDTEWYVLPFLSVRKIRYCAGNMYLCLSGRAGQSMSEAIWRANIGHRVKVWCNIATSALLMDGLASDVNREVVKQMVCSGVKGLYLSCMLDPDRRRAINLLASLDTDLLCNNKELYFSLAKARLSRRFRFHFIDFWRNHRQHDVAISYALRMFTFSVKWINKIASKLRRPYGLH